MNATTPEVSGMRLDKWLWAARFFKTRELAIAAVNGGKVQVDGQRAKPARLVRPGSRLSIRKGELSWDIAVLDLSRQRRPAVEAQRLYAEDEASRLRRQALVQERRLAGHQASGPRPTKRDRRQIERFATSQGPPPGDADLDP